MARAAQPGSATVPPSTPDFTERVDSAYSDHLGQTFYWALSRKLSPNRNSGDKTIPIRAGVAMFNGGYWPQSVGEGGVAKAMTSGTLMEPVSVYSKQADTWCDGYVLEVRVLPALQRVVLIVSNGGKLKRIAIEWHGPLS